MKGVVLSGGTGSRLRPITFSMPKQLVPVANKPILHYGLEDIAGAGITEVAIIVSPETGDAIRAGVGDGAGLGLDLTYVVQPEPLGLAHALGCALDWVDGDDVLMYLGDNIIKDGVSDIVDDYRQRDPNCQILLTRVDDPTSFGVAELDRDGQVQRLVEKPSRPRSDLALVGAYLFDDSIREAVAQLRPSARGEYEITDAIQYLVDTGRTVRSSQIRGWWKDTGKKQDLLDANELVMRDLAPDVQGEVIGGQVRGPVQVAVGARLVECNVVGPCVIGPGADLRRVTIGPHTSIGASTVMADCHVEGSILMDHVQVDGWRLRNSLIGRHTRLRGPAPRGFVHMMLGDRSDIRGS